MSEKIPTAFVSYSWDNPEHENWVMQFVNRLRKDYGVDATFDKFETQNSTVHLNQMMITHMRDSDYIIIVLTENYARKADAFQGGVGYETLLSLESLKQNPDRFIFVVRNEGDFSGAFPFHLQGYIAFNFSDDDKFETELERLACRIHGQDYYEKAPIGPKPQFAPKKAIDAPRSRFADLAIKKVKTFTDQDKIQFMKENYSQICTLLQELLREVQKQSGVISFTYEEIHSRKALFSIFRGRQLKTSVKIWLGSFGGSQEAINLSYGRMVNIEHDNSINEMIVFTLGSDHNPALQMNMNMFGNNGPMDAEGVVREIWQRHIRTYIGM